MTHATPFDNPNTVQTHPPADRLIESISTDELAWRDGPRGRKLVSNAARGVDRTMTRNSGNPDAVAEVPDSQVTHYASSWFDYKTGKWVS